MCEECQDIHGKIERYRSLLTSRVPDDRALLEGLTELIDQLQALKIALHPDQANASAIAAERAPLLSKPF
jgi:hypothetical protein